ncbi:MAG: hypothetical protein ACRDNS_17755 [Trebonia sp.]
MRAYFASDLTRTLQTCLGLLWLLDGALQFQSFMYSKGFIDMLTQMISGQPPWLQSTMRWSSHLAAQDLTVYNTLFALTQVLLGLGILFRPTVKPALAASFVWTLMVWWFGEAFGMLFMNMANPLTGAPGAVFMYGLLGLIVWPDRTPGGLLGARGTRIAWAALWLTMAWLWLVPANSTADATRDAINVAPSGMSWLSTVQYWVAGGAHGHGVAIALLLALASAVIGLGVACRWQVKPLLAAAIVLNLAYWVLGQGLGGIFAGGATDPNTAPLFVLLAVAVGGLTPARRRAAGHEPARRRLPAPAPAGPRPSTASSQGDLA